MNIKITDKKGITLLTDNTICEEDIKIEIDESILGETKPEQEKSVTPSTAQQDVEPDEGYTLSKVTVEAIPSEYVKPSGELEVTDNGTYDVTEKKSVNVNVEKGIYPTGTLEITENGEYDVIDKAYVEVNVAGSGGSVEVPPVTDLAVDENYILTFTEPDVSELIKQGDLIKYVITINETTIEVDNNSVDISTYLVSGENNILVVVKVILSSDEVITSVEQTAVFSETIATLETTLPEARMRMCVATFDTNVYIFGGTVGSDKWKNDILKFDRFNETLTTISSTFPAGFNSASATVIGTNAYIFGGEGQTTTYLNTIYKFDSLSETVTTLETTLPGTRTNMGVATVGTNVYLFGGHTGSGSSSTGYNTIYKFDSLSETVTTLETTLPGTRTNMGVATVGTNVYLFGGIASTKTSATKYNTIYKFDSLSETVTTLETTLPKTIYYLSAGINEKNAYLFGGYDGTQDLKTIYKFDSVSETISLIDTTLPTAPSYYPFRVANYKDVIYLFGGNGKTDKYIYKFY